MHSIPVTIAAAAFFVANFASAAPTQIVTTPETQITAAPSLENRQDGTVNGVSSVAAADFICTLSQTDPSSFQNSGATEFVDQFLVTNGVEDWLNNMDKQTTGDGTQPSTLHCNVTGGGSCEAPQTQCKFFTPPECG
jgi:hypothetical protein